jgi:cyclophilin family peptidyl-prolyl cis-trans isomerase
MSTRVKSLLAGAVAVAGLISFSLNWPAGQANAKKNLSAPKATAIAEADDSSANPIVEVDTSKGPVKIKIFKKQAPITAGNFLDLVNRKFYDGLTFHRYEPNFVIQGGDPVGNGTGDFVDPKTHQKRTIKLEKVPGLTHDKAGAVAMARSDNPDSASCQWYITLAPSSFLDQPPGYAVFGQVVEGMDNVMKLRKGDKMTKVFVAK